ncbi:hypothetical protein [Deinococcus sp. YIM 77859]|uniref:hypothetical protein n=1 Tax=Deinococcus sp. YIM 77859 TaxID=1540221 RepID=UPI0006897546|nr:hypothetical protein [Deinococcus sp. YIM 77859]
MNTITPTPKDGTYSYRAPLSGASMLARFEGGKLAYLARNGEAQPLTPLAALHVAHELSYLDGVAFMPLARPIGKAAGCRLHKHMARAGIPSGEHYAFAARTLGRPVASLAALSPVEARRVWRDLCAYAPRLTA